MSKPNFFIVGAPKCGTTAMYEYLRAHPDIYMPEEAKEPHYFAQEFQPWRANSPKTLEAYLKLFEKAGEAKRIGEASVFYLYSETAAQNIHDFDPDAKIIIMLRNPVDMVYSLYAQQVYNGDETLPTLEAALEAEAARKYGQMIPRRAIGKGLLYREIGKYAQQVQRYYEMFGSGNIHIILFDDFTADVGAAYQKTLEFLSVDTSFVPTFERVNANKKPRFPALNRIIKKPPMWYVYVKAMPRRLFPASVRLHFNQNIKKIMVVHEARLPMQPQTKRQLQDDFREDIDALGDLLGRDLSHWYNPDS